MRNFEPTEQDLRTVLIAKAERLSFDIKEVAAHRFAPVDRLIPNICDWEAELAAMRSIAKDLQILEGNRQHSVQGGQNQPYYPNVSPQGDKPQTVEDAYRESAERIKAQAQQLGAPGTVAGPHEPGPGYKDSGQWGGGTAAKQVEGKTQGWGEGLQGWGEGLQGWGKQ